MMSPFDIPTISKVAALTVVVALGAAVEAVLNTLLLNSEE